MIDVTTPATAPVLTPRAALLLRIGLERAAAATRAATDNHPPAETRGPAHGTRRQ